ncbi:MAG: hypothetical protein HS130_02410 [Deltaproteobacteria bacterium]|nr:hypothetical protein [Deltaproteobacteria bacterium]MCL4873581.1 DUF483 domain-containing protein [bacterium]
MDNTFLLKLGGIYLSKNLFEPAVRVLTRIPESDAHYFEATEKLVQAYYRMSDFRNVIRRGEELLSKDTKGESSTYDIMGYLGTAYSHEGEKNLAKEYFLKDFSFLPSNEQIADRLKKLTPGSERSSIDRLLEELPSAGLTLHVLFDCIAPLLHETRQVTCCFLDQMDEALFAFSHNTFLVAAEMLFKRFGIYTAFLRFAQDSFGFCKVYFSFRPTLLQEVCELEEIGWKEFEESSDENKPSACQREKEGVLLGYPNCCVKWAGDLRRAGQSIEVEALADLIAEEYACSMEGPSKPRPEFVYFGFEFYPCKARCAEAENIGRHSFAIYQKVDPAFSEIYRHYILRLNHAKIYDVPTSNYRYFLKNFNSEYYSAIEGSSSDDKEEGEG